MKKRIVLTVILSLAWLFFASLFYKTIMLMLIALVWQSVIRERLPERIRPYGIKIMWCCLVLCLWIAMPRYRIHTTDRVRLVYLDDEGNAKHAPFYHYLINTFIPEEEVVNLGIKNVLLIKPIAKKYGIGGPIVKQAQDDFLHFKIHNFLRPYRRLGLENPLSGVYPQVFNQYFGTKDRAVYICDPKHQKSKYDYPLVVFCHGYMGNWQLYQGIWKDLDDCIVLSIGTKDLKGIFYKSNLEQIFEFYIPALERMGYHIDHKQIHLIGLSNGGSAIGAAMHSSYSKRFKSITTISCSLSSLNSVPCQVNFVGGGKDGSSKGMKEQCKKLKKMGVDADIYFTDKENHFILVNERRQIVNFLNTRFNFEPVLRKK